MLFDSVPSVAEGRVLLLGEGVGRRLVRHLERRLRPRSCLRDTFIGYMPGDTKELADAIREWGQDRDVAVDFT